MPIGAENIGTAYVRVIADGKDFDLSDMFDSVEYDAGRSGRRSSKSFVNAWDEEMSKAPNQEALRSSLRDSLLKMDIADAFLKSKEWKAFRSGLIKDHKDIGRLAGDNLEQEILAGIPTEQIGNRLADIRRDLAKARTQLAAAEQEQEREDLRLHLDTIAAYRENDLRNFKVVATQAAAIRENTIFDQKVQLQLQAEGARQAAAIRENAARDRAAEMATLSMAYRMNAEFNRKRMFQIRREAFATVQLGKTYKNLRYEIEQMSAGQGQHTIDRQVLIKDLKDLAVQMENAGVMTKRMRDDVDRQHDALLRMHPQLNIYRRRVRDIADVTGAAFGRGSRNNFLNFAGSVARNVIRLGGSLLDLMGYFGGLANRMRDAGSLMGAFGVAIKDVRRLATGAIGGLAGLFTIIGPLTSILSGLGGMILAVASSMGGALLGAISALSSTIVFGLGGALAVVAGAFAPLIAGIGVFALAATNADRDTKKALSSIADSFSGLGEVAAESVFSNIGEQARRFKAIIGDLSPLVSDIGIALSKVGDGWLDLMEGKGFRDFRSAMEDFLPDAVENLGAVLGNVAAGFGGLFRALIPQTEVFLDYLVDITDNFRRFTNSANGQTTLRNFFADASASAATLGSFLSAVRTLLAEVFEQANAPGDGLFASMTRGLLDWADALDRNPDIMGGWMRSMESFGEFTGSVRDLLLELVSAGQEVGDDLFGSMSAQIDKWVASIRGNPDILGDWYKSAAEFARVLGEVVVGAGKVFSALDNSFSRSLLSNTFEVLANAIDGVATALGGIANALGIGSERLGSFAGQVGAAALVLPLLTKALGVSAIVGWVAAIKNAETRVASLRSTAKSAAGIGGLLLLTSAFGEAKEEGITFGGVMKGVAGGAGIGAMFGPMGALIGGVAGGGLAALAGSFAETAEGAEKARVQLVKTEGFSAASEGAETLATALAGVVTAYGKIPRAAVEASFTGKDGKLAADVALLRELGVSMDTITSAALGQADAQKIVNDALGVGATQAEKFYEARKKDYEQALQTYGSNSEITDNFKQDMLDAEKALNDVSAATDVFGQRVDENGNSISAWREKVAGLREQLGLTRAEYNAWPKEVRTQIEQDGMTQTSADSLRLIGQYKELQSFKNIRAIVSADGATLTEKQVKTLKQQYDLTPKQVRTLIRTEGLDLSEKQIRGLIKTTKDLDKQEARPRVKADTKDFDREAKNVRGEVRGLGKLDATPRVKINDKDFISGAAKVKREGSALDRQVSTPKIRVDKTVIDRGVRVLDTDLGNLHRKVTIPKVGIKRDEINKGIADLNSDLGNLHSRVTTPKVTADVSAARSALSGIKSQLDSITSKSVTVTVNTRRVGDGPATASGGIFNYAQNRLIGEAGPEAVVPLARNLSLVDPSVRWLSALAQGKVEAPSATGGGASRTISADGWTIVSPSADPEAVAAEVINRLAATGY